MIKILFENNDIIAIDKPAGLLSVPGVGENKQDSVEKRIRSKYPGAVAIHRLDMSTSGLMLLAKHKDAERYYKRCFEQRQVEKTYIAHCHNIIEQDSGSIDLPLIVDWPNRPRQMVSFEHGKSAHTKYQVLNRFKNYTRIALFPYTGRSHQLRVHLAAIGHPIMGDELYGNTQDSFLPRLYLHAYQIKLMDCCDNLLTLTATIPF